MESGLAGKSVLTVLTLQMLKLQKYEKQKTCLTELSGGYSGRPPESAQAGKEVGKVGRQVGR